MQSKFHITHLYPNELALYGDIGNIIAIQRMLDDIGWEYSYQAVNIGDNMPQNNDLIFIGGGQDQEQAKVAIDLLRHVLELKKLVNSGTSLLAVCGGYQLLGESLELSSGNLPTLKIFPVMTTATQNNPKTRCIGNIFLESMLPGISANFVGFENHSGQTTFVGDYFAPLGKVVLGQGNSFEAGYEGCVYKSAIGTYLHNFLPKNPEVTAWLINKALESKMTKGEVSLAMYQMVKEFDVDTTLVNAIRNNLFGRFLKPSKK
jgi:lipid II isoglutaminyl synthase (glutamine-hydrolysing)